MNKKQILVNLSDEKLGDLENLSSVCIQIHVYIPDLDSDV